MNKYVGKKGGESFVIAPSSGYLFTLRSPCRVETLEAIL